MEAVFFLLFAVVFYIVYRALKGKPQAAKVECSYHGKSYPFSEIKDDPNFPHIRSIHTKVRGVTYSNPDGADRQKIIQQWCQSGDAVYFAREKNNPVDRNAIQVRRVVCSDVPDKPRLGEQLGYLSRELAEELAPDMDKRGFVLMGRILNVTGGHDHESFGVNIQVEQYMPVKESDGALPATPRKKPASHRKRKDESTLPATGSTTTTIS
jgi:HIRAN domain